MFFTSFILFSMLIHFSFTDKIEEEWEKFKTEYSKTYDSPEQEQQYFKGFKENLNDINTHNKLFDEGKVSYRKGINKFADLTDEEFVSKYRFDKRLTTIFDEDPNYGTKVRNSSDYFDWREKGAVTRVKNQDTCGACWIYASVGALEGLYFRKTNQSVTLSEQNLVDCISNHTCRGGWPGVVFRYIFNGNGINAEKDYPPKPVPGTCNYQKSRNIKIDLQNVDFVDNNEEALKTALVKYGPIVVCIYAGEKWKLYNSGVWYEKECSVFPNHAVLLVGYGSENGHDYWLIKNSHSKDWGEKGYMKIARNKHHNYCSITKFAMYLT